MLTILIIGLGLTALIGVLTAVDGLKFWFTQTFTSLGSNTLRIKNYGSAVRTSGGGAKRANEPIDYHQALQFKSEFEEIAPVSLLDMGSFTAKAKHQNKQTPNNLQIFGSDENYVLTNQYSLDEGRNITPVDVQLMRNVMLIGKEVQDQLFPDENPLGKDVQVNGRNYTVIGTFEKRGSTGLMGGDKIMVIPASTLNKDFPKKNRSYSLVVYVENLGLMDRIALEAKSALRQIRDLRPADEDDFQITRVEQYVDELMEDLRFLRWAAYAISIITLFSASIGLMNIMLVSVKERTREIGVRKALGATQRDVRLQFLTEAVMITQAGGLLGILLGILAGNVTAIFTGTDFIFPWNWVIMGVVVCLIVGVVSGYYPARKAAAVDPIESLRYE